MRASVRPANAPPIMTRQNTTNSFRKNMEEPGFVSGVLVNVIDVVEAAFRDWRYACRGERDLVVSMDVEVGRAYAVMGTLSNRSTLGRTDEMKNSGRAELRTPGWRSGMLSHLVAFCVSRKYGEEKTFWKLKTCRI